MTSPFAAFRAILCLSTALMMVISWPLWVSGGLFPRVPFVGGLQTIPVWASWIRFWVTIAAMIVASSGFRWRSLVVVAIGLSAWMVLEDQHRLQPWMYQFVLMGFAIAVCSEVQAAGLCRVFVIALYLHSGLSKLDVAFVTGLGNTFLTTATGFVGATPSRWPEKVREAAILLMPSWEILVAIGLVFPRTRRVAVMGAVVQHGLLLLILGPLGLRHSTNVLLWNVAIAYEVVLLFRWRSPNGGGQAFRLAPLGGEAGRSPGEGEPGLTLPDDDPGLESSHPTAARSPSLPKGRGQAGDARSERLSSLARLFMILVALLPFVERAGLWDTWPSFALYSAHDERADFLVQTEDLAAFPEEIRRHFRNSGTFELLFFNDWSLAERGAPVYPQGRALNGVAEALAVRYRGPWPPRLIQKGRAEALTGRRVERELFGLEAIRRHGDSYLLNAHPAP